MRIFLLINCFVCLCSVPAFAQHEADNWYFGNEAGITFKNGVPVDLPNGKLNSDEGCATISDKITGQILFYTNGDTVWNRNHQIMDNGTGLLGGTSSTQSVLIVPNPGDNEQYYVFTVPDLTSAKTPRDKNYTTKMHYSLVSLQAPDGVVLYKNIPLIDEVSEKLTGTLDCSGEGFWVLAHHKAKNEIYSFHVTSNGVEPKPVTSVYFEKRRTHVAGYMKLSPDRSKLAIASYYAESFLGLLDFNSQTGEATNYKYLGTPNSNEHFYGISFSPDNTKLYAGTQSIFNSIGGETSLYQYEVSSYISSINATLVNIPISQISALQLGIDGKIYITPGDSAYLDVIDKPNLKGIACGYRTKAVQLSRKSRTGLPNFMEYQFGVPTTNIALCSTIDSIEIGPQPVENTVYSWSPTTGLSNPTIANPMASPQLTTEYTLTTTYIGSCATMHRYIVNVVAKPEIAPVNPICEGGSVQLLASGGDTYSWYPATGLDSSTITNPRASPKITTRYKVVVSKGDCVDSAFVDVKVIRVVANPGADKTICEGVEFAQLGATPESGSSYIWSPVTGIDNPYIANPIASPSVTTKYKLTVTNGDCKDSTYMTVNVIPFSGAKAGADKNICPTSSTQLGDKPEPGNKYSWQPTTNLNDATLANPTTSPTTNMQYILTVTSEYGCIAYDTVLVTIGAIVAKVSPDTAICSGSSVQLIASGGAEYEWSPSVGLSNSTIENPIATPAITTQYKVIVSSGTCKDSAFVTVTVNSQPTADAGADQTICSGEPVNIGVPAIAGNTYSWQPPTGLNDATISNPTASPTITTEYILTVTSNGCVAFDTVDVKVGNLTAKVSGDVSICAGKTAQLLASGGVKYEWSPSDGLNDTSIPNPTASPIVTTRYKVVVSSGSCIDSAFVTVTIAPPPIADAGNDRVICIGESTQIGTIADPANSYSWSPSKGLVSPLSSQTIASPTTTTTYTLTVTNPAGCVNYDTITISVNPLNERSFILQPDTVIITPGQQFRVNLNVSSGVSDWGVRLGYNPLLIKYISINNGLQAIADDQKGELAIRGSVGNTTSSITFDAFLPHTSDTIYAVKLSIDTTQVAPCETSIAVGNILKLSDYCGKNIRVVSASGKSYFLTVKGNTIDFGVGLSGNVRLEVFDYLGNSMQILNDGNLEAGAYSAEIDLPTGVYFCRMRAGMYESVGKVMVGF